MQRHLTSRDIIDHMTIRFAILHFAIGAECSIVTEHLSYSVKIFGPRHVYERTNMFMNIHVHEQTNERTNERTKEQTNKQTRRTAIHLNGGIAVRRVCLLVMEVTMYNGDDENDEHIEVDQKKTN